MFVQSRHFRFVWLSTLIFAALPFCTPARAQYSPQDAFNILTQSDGAACNEQFGSYYPVVYNAGCCGSPGFRVCARVLHFGKGTWGISAGCTDPDPNQVNGPGCELPAAPPAIPRNALPSGRPPVGTSIDFMVTSDLHFYRDWFNVKDQVSHPSSMMNWSFFDSQGPDYPLTLSHNKYGALLIAGDMSTGALDSGYSNRDYRISGYRMMYENSWGNFGGYLPGASMGIPVFPTLGNHDFNDSTWFAYMAALTQQLNSDRNHTGCLVGISPGCIDEGGLGGTLNYSFEWQGIHFLMLNTWPGDQNSAAILGSDGLTWLSNDLQHYAGSTNKPVIVVQHYGLDANTVSGGPWWTADNTTAFENILSSYNVLGVFTGHTHTLGMNTAAATVNNRSTSGFGTTLDNFNDGAGGDCHSHGEGTIYEPSNPLNATFCGHATASFLAVHIDDKYMQVRAISYSDRQAPNLDSSIGMVGESSGDQGSCKKWVGGYYNDISTSANISVDNTKSSITVSPASPSSSIPGPLALWIDGTSLNQWDFVDSCGSSTAHKFLLLTSQTLQQAMSVSFSGGTLSAGSIHLIQLAPQFIASPAQQVIGTTPTTITISSTGGTPIAFQVAIDGGSAFYNAPPWLKVSPDPTNTIFNTPQTFTLSEQNYSGPQEFQNLYITDPSGRATPLNIYMPLASPVLSLVPNAVGAIASIYGSTVNLPSSYSGEPAGGEHVPLSVTTPQFPAPGTRLLFQDWGDGGAQSHAYLLGCCGTTTNLAVNFETQYLVTATAGMGGAVQVNPPSADGYYKSQTALNINATPNANYYFTGYTGGIVSPNNRVSEALAGPLSFAAGFAVKPQLTFTSNAPAGAGSQITVQGQALAVPFSQSLTPGGTISVTATVTFVSTLNPGIQYVFQTWSDGDTNSTRSIVVPASDTTYTATYTTQALVSVTAKPANGGTTAGSGWYPANSSVTLTATAAQGYYFAGFSGDVSSGINPFTLVTAGQPLNITANFLRIPQVTVSSFPSNQVIYVDNVAYLTPRIFAWLPGENHTVDATKTNPPTGVHLILASWSDGGTPVHQVTVPAVNESLTAVFNTAYFVSVTTSGAGSVAVSPVSPTGDGYYAAMAPVTFTALPLAGNYFAGFGGALSGTASPRTIALNGPVVVLASFAAVPQVTAGVTSINDSDPNTVQLGLLMKNSGQGAAGSLSITAVTTTDLAGSGLVTVSGLPSAPIVLAAGQSATVPVSIAWPASARRVQFKLQFTANNGAYAGAQTINLFR